MIDHGIALPYYRLHVVPAVVALASPTWQRDVWLDPGQFEDLDYTVHVLFDDFCDADNPSPWLGQCLRSEEEVELMAGLGAAYNAVQDSIGSAAPDEVYLDSPGWSAVVAAAARLAQVMVSNDHLALSKLHDAGYRWPLGTEPVASGTDDQHSDS
ncbi:SCO4402 family protein [Streptomyces bacillaris]|uniref:SCO4402 family protein n=1 Tax=Streptomyces bacillaris TaxID=68179 RepID=UPI003466A46D